MTDKFTTDNTEGYSQDDLAKLNAAYGKRLEWLRSQGVDVGADTDKSLLDHVSERVLTDFDDDLL